MNSDRESEYLRMLRAQAEKKLKERMERLQELSTRDVRDLVHELGTHQIELEMQNEELRRAQEELEASRNRYAELYDFAPIGYLTIDTTGLIREVNLTAAKLLGVERRSLANKPFSAFVHRDDSDAFHRHCAAVVNERTKQKIEIRLKRRDRTEFFLLLESIAVEDPEGKAVALRTAVSDITGRRQAEEALRQSEERFRIITSSTPDHLLVQDRDLRYTFVVNPQLGLTEQEMLGKSDHDLLPKEDADKLADIKRKVLETGKTMRLEVPLLSRDGQRRFFEGSYVPKFDALGRVDGLIGYFRDVTDRKRAEDALRESEEKLKLFIAHAPSALAMFDRDMRYLAFSRRWLSDYGLGDRNIIGLSHYEVFPEIPEHWKEVHRRVQAGEVLREDNDPFVRADGTTQWLRWELRPWRDAAGRIGGIVMFTEEITARKQSEERLRYLASFPQLNPNPVLETNMAGAVTYANPAAEDVLARLGQDRTDSWAFVPDDLGSIIASWDRTKPMTATRDVKIAGRVMRVTIYLTTDLDAARLYVYDITERKRAEDDRERLLTEVQKARNELAADLDAMTRLQKLSTLFVYEDNLDPVLSETVEAAIAITGADFGSIQLFDSRSQELRIEAQRGFPQWWVDFWNSVSPGQGACGMAFKTRRRVIVEDIEESPVFVGTPALDVHRRAGVRAEQSTPLTSRSGELLGMFSTHFKAPRRPDERSLRMLDLLARQASDFIERARYEAALQRSEERYRSLFDNMINGFSYYRAMMDEQGKPADYVLLEVNTAFEKLTGLKRGNIIGRRVMEVFPGGERETADRIGIFRRVALTGRSVQFEQRFEDLGKWFAVSVYAPAAGHVAAVFEDITARKEAERALQESERKFFLLFQKAGFGVALATFPDGIFVDVNEAAENMFGYSRQEVVGKNALDLGLYANPEVRSRLMAQLVERGVVHDADVALRTKSLEERSFLMNMIQLEFGGRKHYIVTVVDISDRRRAEDALKGLNDELEQRVEERTAELRNLQAHVEALREGERTHVAREVHDQLGQVLTALKMDIAWLQRNHPAADPEVRERAEEMRELIDGAIHSVKRITAELRPAVLDDFGLQAAVEWALKEFEKRSGVKCGVRSRPATIELDRMHGTVIYRVLQESLTNIARHAGAKNVSVSLNADGERFQLTITDDGKGIAAEKIDDPASFGLMGMRERLRFLGGELSVSAGPEGGTTVTASMPLRSAAMSGEGTRPAVSGDEPVFREEGDGKGTGQ